MMPFLTNLSVNRSYFIKKRNEDIKSDHDTQSGVKLKVHLIGAKQS